MVKKVQYGLLYMWVNQQIASLRHIGPRRLFINPHMKRSVYYLLCCFWMFGIIDSEKSALLLPMETTDVRFITHSDTQFICNLFIQVKVNMKNNQIWLLA